MPDGPQSSPTAIPEKNRFDVYTFIVATFVSILVAAVGSGTTIVTTQLTIDDQRAARTEEVRNVQLEAARAKREVVYQAFIDAANAYVNATNDLLDSCNPPPRSDIDAISKACPATFNQFQTARFKYQGTINDMYTFGTPRARAALLSIVGTLPPGISSRFSSIGLNRPDPVQVNAAFATFTLVQCNDVRIDLTQECS